MNSEKVKEIKESLQQEIHLTEYVDSAYSENVSLDLLKDVLTLINELESENKELRVVTDIANERTYRKKFTDEWRKEYQKELDKQGNGHIAGHPDFDLVYKLYFEQKERIVELEKEIEENAFYSKGYADGIKNTYEVVMPDKLKQFAERLIDKKIKLGDRFNIYDIDETLKEYENDTIWKL